MLAEAAKTCRAAGLDPAARLAVFEYHRTPRGPGAIVVANLAEFGPTSALATTGAVKRLRVEADTWVFKSPNPRYDPICIPRAPTAPTPSSGS